MSYQNLSWQDRLKEHQFDAVLCVTEEICFPKPALWQNLWAGTSSDQQFPPVWWLTPVIPALPNSKVSFNTRRAPFCKLPHLPALVALGKHIFEAPKPLMWESYLKEREKQLYHSPVSSGRERRKIPQGTVGLSRKAGIELGSKFSFTSALWQFQQVTYQQIRKKCTNPDSHNLEQGTCTDCQCAPSGEISSFNESQTALGWKDLKAHPAMGRDTFH